MIFSLILWSPFKNNFEDVISDFNNSNIRIVRKNIFCFENENFESMVKKVYEPDSIADWKIIKKLEELSKRERILCYLEIEIPSPRYRVKSDGRHISIATEEIKKFIRTKYASLKPFQGKPDILVHMGDTHDHTYFVFNTLQKYAKKKINLQTFINEIKDIDYAFTKIETPYQADNFPKDYAHGKDIDILVSKEDAFILFEKLNDFKLENSGLFKTKIIFEKNGARVRFLNSDNSLHYQIDIKISGLATKENINVHKDGYKIFSKDIEIINRLNALELKPHKTHHKDYILKEKNNINLKTLKKYNKIGLYESLVGKNEN
tara:strand:- start:93 stop:1049 length:957 start_codon:yes stop_codon:yes gene_type:complete